MTVRLSWGMSTPRIRGIRRGLRAGGGSQPCRCLCLGFEEQMTYTLPRRRTTLQFSQIRRTLDRIFIGPILAFATTGNAEAARTDRRVLTASPNHRPGR